MRHYDTSCGPMSCVPTRKGGIPEFVIKALYCCAVDSVYGHVNNSCLFIAGNVQDPQVTFYLVWMELGQAT